MTRQARTGPGGWVPATTCPCPSSGWTEGLHTSFLGRRSLCPLTKASRKTAASPAPLPRQARARGRMGPWARGHTQEALRRACEGHRGCFGGRAGARRALRDSRGSPVRSALRGRRLLGRASARRVIGCNNPNPLITAPGLTGDPGSSCQRALPS